MPEVGFESCGQIPFGVGSTPAYVARSCLYLFLANTRSARANGYLYVFSTMNVFFSWTKSRCRAADRAASRSHAATAFPASGWMVAM